MTEQEFRELMREKLKASGLQESVSKIAEMMTDAYCKGFEDGMEVGVKLKNEKKGE